MLSFHIEDSPCFILCLSRIAHHFRGCSSSCSCSDQFLPVCSEYGETYYSACYAGCTTTVAGDGSGMVSFDTSLLLFYYVICYFVTFVFEAFWQWCSYICCLINNHCNFVSVHDRNLVFYNIVRHYNSCRQIW